MSIYFSFKMEPKKKLLRKEELDFDEISEIAKEYEREGELKIKADKAGIHAEFCPEGILFLKFIRTKGIIKGDCPTYLAGPGFHAAAVIFLEDFAKELGLKLTIEDETGYAKHRDFEKMRTGYFYPWLKYMMSLICDYSSQKDFKMCWDITEYTPETIPGTVISPIRRFSMDEIQNFYRLPMEVFAREFFVWPDERRNALHFRNSALMFMNTRCHFMFSDRNLSDGLENVRSIQLLERALSLDSELPFPKAEYRLICRLHEQDPRDLEGVPEFRQDCEIGYRKGAVYHQLGQFIYSVPGRCLEKRNRETNTLFYYDDEPGRWHNIKITSFYAERGVPTFNQKLFEGTDVEGVADFPVGDGNARLAIRHPVVLPDSPEGYYYEMAAQMILDRQMLLVEQRFCREDELKEVLNWFKNFNGKRRRR